jgi:hypothetical protein
MHTDAANPLSALNASTLLPLANDATKLEPTRVDVIDAHDIPHDTRLFKEHLWDPPHACDMSPAPLIGALESATLGRA